MNKLNEALKIADIHKSRIQTVAHKLESIFPLSKEKVTNLTEEQVMRLDFLTFRFSKLQDLMGQKIIDEFLMSKEEIVEGKSMIDKINKLERIGIITDAHIWQEMRKIRNHISHEYPNHPEITARHLNKLFELTPKLIEILDRIKAQS